MQKFIEGFAKETGLNIQQASEQWAAFSRQLSELDRGHIEAGGFDSGVTEGFAWNLEFGTTKGATR